jgi:hypothetical protein
MTSFTSSRLGGFLLFAFAVLCSGCSDGPGRATVKGKVTLGDKPVPVGNVMFWGKDNFTASATLDKDGNYSLADAPVGDIKISVQTPKLPPGGLDVMKRMKNHPGMKEGDSVDPNDTSKRIGIMGNIPENIVPVPDKYGDPTLSGLTYTVKKGEQTYDIKLTP